MNPYAVVGQTVELRVVRPWWKLGRRRVLGQYVVTETHANTPFAGQGPVERMVILRELEALTAARRLPLHEVRGG